VAPVSKAISAELDLLLAKAIRRTRDAIADEETA
jgi:hypothetical protein